MTVRNSSPALFDASDRQDDLFASAFCVLQEGIIGGAFPAASAAVTLEGRLLALKGFGHFTHEADSPAVSAATLFDLASLTKVVATTSMAMVLYERGLLDLDAPVAAVIPEFLEAVDGRRQLVTLHMLLAHSSGLPAYEKLFLKARTRDELVRAAFTTPLAAEPGSRADYSDIGFIILGAALERLADEAMDSFCQREIFAPVAMTNTGFNPPADISGQIAPTADDRSFRHRIIQGEVQDENASILGGVAGHAGLFSTARDLANFAHSLLNAGAGIFRPETIALFTRREPAPAGTSRALGWDTPSRPSQSGEHFGPASFGHLGYTGTSLWIDPDRKLSIALLTNRTWLDCSNQAIKIIRPRFHNAVIGAVQSFQPWHNLKGASI